MESILHYLVGISVGWDLLFKGSVILFLCWIFHFSLRRLHPLWRILVFRVGVSALALLPLYASVLPEIPLPLLTKSDSFIEHAPARFSPQTVISDEASQSDTSPYSDSHPAKGNMGTLLIILWFVITAILFTRLLFSYKAIRKIMNNAAAAPETVQSTLRSVQEQLRVKETIQARFSEEVSIPFIATCGARTIVLPRRMVEPDFSGELPGVLAHEVSHLIYHDIFWLTFMDILSRLLWFHPLFWKIPSVHAGDCEESTDIIASQCLGDVTLYSGTLARAALDLLTKTPIPARGAIPMARMPEIRSRLQKLKRSFYFSAIRKKSQIICVVLSAFCLLVLSSIKITYADSGKQDAMPKDPQKYTEKEIRQKSADFFFERIGNPEPGYHGFSPLWALIEKGKTSDEKTRTEIITKAGSIIADLNQSFYRRWICCYVLSGTGDPRGVPAVISALEKDPSEIVRSVAAEALGQFGTDDARAALEKALKTEKSERVLQTIRKRLGSEVKTEIITYADIGKRDAMPKDPQKYTEKEIRQKSADFFFERIGNPEPGYHGFSPLWALIEKGKTSDEKTRMEIITKAGNIIADLNQSFYRRWICCYVLSGTGDPRGVPAVISALEKDPSEIVRSVAAEALGQFGTDDARAALEKALKTEKSERVLQTIRKRLNL